MEFNNYTHFKNYCFKIAQNKEYNLSKEDKSTFNQFEKVVKTLFKLSDLGVINIKENIYEVICQAFKGGMFENTLSNMQYIIRKLNKCLDKEIDFYYVTTSLSSMLGINLQFTSRFLLDEKAKKSIFYPCRVSILEINDEEEKIYTIDEYDYNYKGKYGVYFIYDVKGNIAYIGKSTSCLLTRSFQSAKERRVLDFSKIELRETKSKSDVAIYEAYYISKYKPLNNNDLVFDDEVTIELPELEISKLILRDVEKDYFSYRYTYYRHCVVDTDDFCNKVTEGRVMLNTEENINQLMRKGIESKYNMRERAYQKCIEDARQSGKYLTAELE